MEDQKVYNSLREVKNEFFEDPRESKGEFLESLRDYLKDAYEIKEMSKRSSGFEFYKDMCPIAPDKDGLRKKIIEFVKEKEIEFVSDENPLRFNIGDEKYLTILHVGEGYADPVNIDLIQFSDLEDIFY